MKIGEERAARAGAALALTLLPERLQSDVNYHRAKGPNFKFRPAFTTSTSVLTSTGNPPNPATGQAKPTPSGTAGKILTFRGVEFQCRSPARWFGLFSDLRRRNFDLYGAALLAPQFTVVPALDQSGMLHLAGYIPTRPQQINFDLVFQVVGNQWRLYGISIATPEAAPAQPQAQAPPARSSTPAAPAAVHGPHEAAAAGKIEGPPGRTTK